MRLTWGVLALGLVAALRAGRVPRRQAHVTGTASYRERGRAAAGRGVRGGARGRQRRRRPGPAELGAPRIADPGSPPFAFDIAYDPAGVAADRAYSVRAQVSVGRRLIFVSDTVTPVLTRGAPDDADVRMIKVGDTAAEARRSPAAIGAHGLRLPASFAGDMPCSDCDADPASG